MNNNVVLDKKVLPSFEEVKQEMKVIPGFDPEMYLCHTELGKIYSLISNRWLLADDCKGVGDSGYLMTQLRRYLPDGTVEEVPMYEHEAVYSAYFQIPKSQWRDYKLAGEPLQIDHIDRNPRNNNIDNLRLTTEKINKANSIKRYNKTRLNEEIVNQIREEFENRDVTIGKIKWYKSKGKELGVTQRSIQNVILGYTYNQEEVIV